jgi:hypothetical protein
MVAMAPLPGIDLELALTHFDGSQALLRRTLRSFAQSYGQGIDHWKGWMAERRWDELNLAVHTLQGLAATVGAMPLRELALAVERPARARDAVGTAAALPALRQALAQLVAQVDEALATDAGETSGMGALTLESESALAGLRELLEQSDGEAITWWQTHRASLRKALAPPAMRALGQAINAFDFDAALAALDESEAHESEPGR